MCGRFSIISNSRTVAEHYGLSNMGDFIHSYNVTPAKNIPIVRLNHKNKRELVNCHWGLIPHWARDTKLKPINAKAETITEKPFFRSAFRHKRCLIPTNGFYEWYGDKSPKQPYFIKLKNTEIFSFAGLWERWEKNEQAIESCTIITTTANTTMQTIHQRMPVILSTEKYNEWLQEGPRELLIPYAGEMICFPVNTMVNNPANDSKDLIQPLPD